MLNFESTVSATSFALFSELGELNGELIDVIIDRSVDVVDDQGNVRRVAALVHVAKNQCGNFPAWDSGDLLEADSGNVRLRQVIVDDGFIQRIEASPA